MIFLPEISNLEFWSILEGSLTQGILFTEEIGLVSIISQNSASDVTFLTLLKSSKMLNSYDIWIN